MIVALHESLMEAGAVPRFVGPRLGTYETADGGTLEAGASMENSPPVLFDALVLPDGEAGVRALAGDEHTMEFVMNQYRHGKTILALGASRTLRERAGIPGAESGEAGPGVLVMALDGKGVAKDFIAAVSKHPHPEREMDIVRA